jgi:hypothetical protein
MPANLRSAFRIALLFIGGVVAFGCPASGSAKVVLAPASPPPVLVATGGKTGLEFWPIGSRGSSTPTAISGLGGLSPSGGLAASGALLVIPNGKSVVFYNLRSKREFIVPDPDGYATDAAVVRMARSTLPIIPRAAATCWSTRLGANHTSWRADF